MIPKAEFFEWIENYCLDRLNGEERLEFEDEMKNNAGLNEEFELHLEIQAAIIEKDVITLREQLQSITNKNSEKKETGSFELLSDFANIKEIAQTVPSADLINFYDSLPKVHVYQHELASGENIHQFYKEQKKLKYNGDGDFFDDLEDFNELEGLEEAIGEKDILSLRETLSYVAKNIKSQFSSEDIDNYINGELSDVEKERFETEAARSRTLKQEIELHLELENAVRESDILSLRDRLSHIVQTETSWNVTEENIEDFIDGILDGELLETFKAELSENTDLMAEVSLRKNVNDAIGEKSILVLRQKLRLAREKVENTEIKSIVPGTFTNFRFLNIWKQSVAVIILLVGVSGILNYRNNSSPDKTYNMYYNAPQWSPERSVTAEHRYLDEANLYYMNGNYKKAIELYDIAIKKETDNFVFHFYKGASLQNLSKFEEAIPEYDQVIKHGDNLYIEEAEWNKCMCYIKMGNNELAKQQIEAIIDRNGYYKNDAKAVLKRMRYSFRK